MKQIIAVVIILVLTACTPSVANSTPIPTDKLAEIQARGTLVVATDADYQPQSYLIEGSEQRPGTKCEPTQYTANQFEGFDVDVAVQLAAHLGVEPCFVTPPWSQLVAGDWGDNWDIHVGSVAITFDRMKDLYFSTPYYATPTVLLVHRDNTSYKKAEDLSGKRIGACVGCTFEAYLNSSLKMPGQEITFRIKRAQIVAYETEQPAIEALSLGDGVQLDGLLTILPKANNAIAAGEPVKILGEPLLFGYASITLDRSSARSPIRLWSEINRFIQGLHNSGVLSQLSVKYHGVDLSREAASFDIYALEQFP